MIQITTDQTNMEELMTYSLNLICNNELPDVFKPTCLKVKTHATPRNNNNGSAHARNDN